MPFPVGEDRIEEAEAQLGRTLPAALRDRLMRDNGGEIEVDAGLALAVSERNPVAVRLYEHLGFQRVGRTPTGLLTMLWSARRSDGPP